MNGIVISVDYGDLLNITLPRNAPHFEKVLVVSTAHDHETAAVVAGVPNAELFVTDAFYRSGAAFNKGRAMEEGFDVLGRAGWMTIFDADTLFPGVMFDAPMVPGHLYSSWRRLLLDPQDWCEDLDWGRLPRKREAEFAGFLQIFHADDPVLRSQPWYGIDWTHAGGCDSDFQKKWPDPRKIRLDFDVLHIGEPDSNWVGRATKRTDGSVPEGASDKKRKLREMFNRRDSARQQGRTRYEGEKLP